MGPEEKFEKYNQCLDMWEDLDIEQEMISNYLNPSMCKVSEEAYILAANNKHRIKRKMEQILEMKENTLNDFDWWFEVANKGVFEQGLKEYLEIGEFFLTAFDSQKYKKQTLPNKIMQTS